jgi:hypothetical protein
VTGITGLEEADGAPAPNALFATTTKVYVVPLVNPVTVRGEVAPEAVKFPGFEVTVYPAIVFPPLKDGALKVTVARALSGTTETIVGASGTVTGIAVAIPLGLPGPAAFLAETLKSYDTPFDNPVTVKVTAVDAACAKVIQSEGEVLAVNL